MTASGVHVEPGWRPLNGLEGFVDDPTNPRGIVLAVDVLRQGLLIRVPAEQLRPLH